MFSVAEKPASVPEKGRRFFNRERIASRARSLPLWTKIVCSSEKGDRLFLKRSYPFFKKLVSFSEKGRMLFRKRARPFLEWVGSAVAAFKNKGRKGQKSLP